MDLRLRRSLMVAAAAAVGGLALRAFWPLPKVPLRLSAATTYLSAPALPQGGIDYDQVLRPALGPDGMEILQSAQSLFREVPDVHECGEEPGRRWLARQDEVFVTVQKIAEADRFGRTADMKPPSTPSVLGRLVAMLRCACIQKARSGDLADLGRHLDLMTRVAASLSNTDTTVSYAMHARLLQRAQACAANANDLQIASTVHVRPPSELIERQRLRTLASLQKKFAARNSIDLNEAMRSANVVFDAVLAGKEIPETPTVSRWTWLLHGMSEARLRSSRAWGIALASLFGGGLDSLEENWQQGQAALRAIEARTLP